MLMGAKAQGDNSIRRTSITETALLKFRQHAPGFSGTDQMVMGILDEAVLDGFARCVPEQYTTEEGDDAWLVDLENETALPLYGVVKHYRDREGRVDLNRKALVTIMKKEFVEKLKASGQWNRGRSTGPVPRETRRTRSVPRAEDQEGEAGKLRLVTWFEKGELCTRETSNEKLSSAIMGLLAEGVGPESIKVWRPIKVDVQVRVAD